MVTVEGRGMQGVPGVAGRVFTAVARSGASILMITQSSSEQSICFLVRSAGHAALVVKAVERELELEMMHGDIDHVNSQDQTCRSSPWWARGCAGTPDIAARVFGALAKSKINVISIAQGSSEYNLSLVVGNGDVDEGVRAIHEQFHLEQA